MKPWDSAPMTAAGRNASSTPITKRAAAQLVNIVARQIPQPGEIDRQQREDRAELDQDRERLAEVVVVQAEEMLHQQQMAGRGDRQEFGEALDQAEHRRFDKIEIIAENAAAKAMRAPKFDGNCVRELMAQSACAQRKTGST